MFDTLSVQVRGFVKPKLSVLGARYSPMEWYRNKDADVFIVWFPKTGGTWVRLLLNSAIARHTGITPTQPLEFDDFAAADPRIPLIRALHEDEPHWKRSEQLSENKQRYRGRRVILLARDPLDTIVSLHFQMTKRWRVTHKRLGEFLWQSRGSLNTLIRYYNIWASSRAVPEDLLLVRYEDLHRDTSGSLRRILRFIGVDGVSERAVQEAVSVNEIGVLRERELAGTYPTHRLQPGIEGDPDSLKARRGKVGGYVDYLTEAEIGRAKDLIDAQLDPWYGYSRPVAAPTADRTDGTQR